MNDLELKQCSTMLEVLGQHGEMSGYIKTNLPAIQKATSNFGKRQSQFMDNMLTVSHPTPLRNIRQILAEIESTMQALRENYFKLRKAEIEVKRLQKKIARMQPTNSFCDEYDIEMKNIELEEKQTQLEAAKLYISGAIRKVTNHMEQYNSILSSIGVKSIDEVDFEKEEERYHIMKAFEQALCAARSHGGIIDEGNHIYLYQVGINGFVAQYELTKYLLHEAELAKKGQEPSHGMVLMFMEQMAQKFSGCSKVFAHRKGMTGEISERASIKALVQ